MATYSSILPWKIPWTEELGRLWSMGLQNWTQLEQFSTRTQSDLSRAACTGNCVNCIFTPVNSESSKWWQIVTLFRSKLTLSLCLDSTLASAWNTQDHIPFLQILLPRLLTTEKAMALHSSTLAWKIPWMEEPSGLQSMGSLRVVHNWATSLSLFTFMHWRRKWQPTPVFLPRESQGWGSLVGFHLWGRTESDMTEAT